MKFSFTPRFSQQPNRRQWNIRSRKSEGRENQTWGLGFFGCRVGRRRGLSRHSQTLHWNSKQKHSERKKEKKKRKWKNRFSRWWWWRYDVRGSWDCQIERERRELCTSRSVVVVAGGRETTATVEIMRLWMEYIVVERPCKLGWFRESQPSVAVSGSPDFRSLTRWILWMGWAPVG